MGTISNNEIFSCLKKKHTWIFKLFVEDGYRWISAKRLRFNFFFLSDIWSNWPVRSWEFEIFFCLKVIFFWLSIKTTPVEIWPLLSLIFIFLKAKETLFAPVIQRKEILTWIFERLRRISKLILNLNNNN